MFYASMLWLRNLSPPCLEERIGYHLRLPMVLQGVFEATLKVGVNLYGRGSIL